MACYTDFHKQKTVKCRKPHPCCYCERKIEKGEYASYHSGKYEDSMYSHHMCLWCGNNIAEIETDGQGGSYEFELGGLHERIADYMESKEQECPKCGTDNTDWGGNTSPDKECIEFECYDCKHKWTKSLSKHFGLEENNENT